MNLTNYYWYFKSAIPERICDDIIKYGNSQREQIALTGGQTRKLEELEAKEKAKPKKKKIISEATAHLSDEYLESLDPAEKLEEQELNDLRKKRDSNIAWLNDCWIYKEVQPYIHQANANAGWNFDWDWSESCQFTKYKLNQFYDWHCDSFNMPYNTPNNLNTHGKIRKLSVTCSLSDAKDYKGGELEFQFRNTDNPTSTIKCLEILPKGSVVVFPSHIWHRVKPVTKGTRYSLVVWNLGYPFK